MTYTITPVSGDAEWQHAVAIRTEVFIEEQACPPEEEWDEHDETARHFLLRVDGVPAGTARWRVALRDERPVAKLERFAVRAPFRGHGLGRALVAHVSADAERAGFAEQVLYAQAHLERFYEGFGFRRCGANFWEAGIDHVPMRKS